MRRLFRYGFELLAAVPALILGLDEHKDIALSHHQSEVALGSIIGLLAVDLVLRWRRERAEQTKTAAKSALRGELGSLLLQVSRDTALDPSHLSASLFLVSRTSVPGHLVLSGYHDTISGLPPRAASWDFGVGVAGVAWKVAEEGRVATVIGGDYGRLQEYADSDRKWASIGANSLGLTRAEFNRLADRPSAVATALMRASGEVVGVLEVHGPSGRLSEFDDPAVERQMLFVAANLRKTVEKYGARQFPPLE